MTKLIFTPEMFESEDFYNQCQEYRIMPITEQQMVVCAYLNLKNLVSKAAQQIFDEWLEKQPVVYSSCNRIGWHPNNIANDATEKASLVCISPIEAKKKTCLTCGKEE